MFFRNGAIDLDEYRRTDRAVREAETVRVELQTRVREEQAESRTQMLQMWIDESRDWVEDEQLQLDGLESFLLNALKELGERQCRADQVEELLREAQARLAEVRSHLGN